MSCVYIIYNKNIYQKFVVYLPFAWVRLTCLATKTVYCYAARRVCVYVRRVVRVDQLLVTSGGLGTALCFRYSWGN